MNHLIPDEIFLEQCQDQAKSVFLALMHVRWTHVDAEIEIHAFSAMCARCGDSWVTRRKPNSNQPTYCPPCSLNVKRETNRVSMAKRREREKAGK